MTSDPIIDEVRVKRTELLGKFGGDIRRYSEFLMKKERASNGPLVAYPLPEQAPQKVAEVSPPYST